MEARLVDRRLEVGKLLISMKFMKKNTVNWNDILKAIQYNKLRLFRHRWVKKSL